MTAELLRTERSNKVVIWPCLLKLAGDDELIYLANEFDLNGECQELIMTEEDLVVDSAGLEYLIHSDLYSAKTTHKLTEFKLVKTANSFSAEQVTDLIRAHELTKAEVCLMKIYFLTVAEAVKSIANEP